MKITWGKDEITVSCTGCMCHALTVQFGQLINGCCSECGCPKTKDAFFRIKTEQERKNA